MWHVVKVLDPNLMQCKLFQLRIMRFKKTVKMQKVFILRSNTIHNVICWKQTFFKFWQVSILSIQSLTRCKGFSSNSDDLLWSLRAKFPTICISVQTQFWLYSKLVFLKKKFHQIPTSLTSFSLKNDTL